MSEYNLKKIHAFTINAVLTHGNKQKEKRAQIRKSAQMNFPKEQYLHYGFEIEVHKNTKGEIVDIENVPKLIVDAFSEKIIKADGANLELSLYDDDTIDNVVYIKVTGYMGDNDHTKITILAEK